MKRIFKYHLKTEDRPKICLPVGAEFLCAQNQGDEIYVWALVDPQAELYEDRQFLVYGTGQPHEGGKYLSTVQLLDGALVLHIFLEGQP